MVSILKQSEKLTKKFWAGRTNLPFYHFAFAFSQSRLVEFGANKPEQPNSKALKIAKKFNIEHWKKFPYLHAESDLIFSLQNKINDNLILVVTRINKYGRIMLSKPCENCEKLIRKQNFKRVFWSLNSKNDIIGWENNEQDKFFLRSRF